MYLNMISYWQPIIYLYNAHSCQFAIIGTSIGIAIAGIALAASRIRIEWSYYDSDMNFHLRVRSFINKVAFADSVYA